MARKAPNTADLSEQSVALAEFAAKALAAADQLGNKKKAIVDFPLSEPERATAAGLPALSATLNRKLATKKNGTFTISDTASILLALAESLLEGEPLELLHWLLIAKKLTDCLESNLVPRVPIQATKKASKPSGLVYQFKITLLDAKPAIWRRIQVQDCTLDKLHEHIQTAMGWTNSHLHDFEIRGRRYGDPEVFDDGLADFECADSTATMLSKVLPRTGKRFAFNYEYDFGDGWEHEILFEGSPSVDSDAEYPLCLEGERACPPEDCGGVWGYTDLLEAISNKGHEQHEEVLEWISAEFDSEAFDAAAATKRMRQRLPDWRSVK